MGLEGPSVVAERLGVGGDPAGLVRGLQEVLVGLGPVLGLPVVVGQEPVELVEALGEEPLDALAHAPVELEAALAQDAAVGGLLHQRVREEVLQLRQPLALPDELDPQQLAELRVELDARGDDRLEHPSQEAPPHHRRDLQDLLDVLLQPVDPGQDDPLDRLRHGDGLGPLRRAPADDLLEEERVALGALEEALGLGGRHHPGTHEALQQLAALLAGERGEGDLGEDLRIGALAEAAQALEWPLAVGPADADDQKRDLAHERQQVLDELGGGLVDPVEVLDHQRHRALPRQTLEEPPDAEEDLRAHGRAVEVAHPLGELAGHLEPEQRREIGEHLGRVVPEEGAHLRLELRARLSGSPSSSRIPQRPRSASRKGQ